VPPRPTRLRRGRSGGGIKHQHLPAPPFRLRRDPTVAGIIHTDARSGGASRDLQPQCTVCHPDADRLRRRYVHPLAHGAESAAVFGADSIRSAPATPACGQLDTLWTTHASVGRLGTATRVFVPMTSNVR